MAALLLALVMAAGLVQHDSRIDHLAPAPAADSAARAALVELGQELRGHQQAATAVASRFGGTADWETGTVTVPGEDPLVFLYVARRNEATGWQAALEGSARFPLLAEQGQMALAGTPSAELLATTTTQTASNGAAQLSLPWKTGTTWRLTGGPHSNNGGRRPWSSLDFAGPRPGMTVKVRAARGGIVVRPCANLVQVRHSGGWTTSYYHVKRIAVRAGQRVARRAFLGYTSTRAGCGGRATGPHLHFALLRYGAYVNIRGHTIGGWTVREGSSQYRGCMVKGSRKRCAPNGSIYNTGSIGSQ